MKKKTLIILYYAAWVFGVIAMAFLIYGIIILLFYVVVMHIIFYFQTNFNPDFHTLQIFMIKLLLKNMEGHVDPLPQYGMWMDLIYPKSRHHS